MSFWTKERRDFAAEMVGRGEHHVDVARAMGISRQKLANAMSILGIRSNAPRGLWAKTKAPKVSCSYRRSAEAIERRKIALQRIAEGKDYTVIANELGVSRERVRQYAEDAGVKGVRSRAVTLPRKAAYEAALRARIAEKKAARTVRYAKAVAMVAAGSSVDSAAFEHGIHSDLLRRAVKKAGVKVIYSPRGRPIKRYDWDQILRLHAEGKTINEIARLVGAPSHHVIRQGFHKRGLSTRLANAEATR